MHHNVLVKAILLAGLFVSAVVGADDPDYTGFLRNGRWWNKAPIPMRSGYLIGIGEMNVIAITFYQGKTGVLKPELDVLPKSLTIAEVAGTLDLFYGIPTNGPVPVVTALRWVKRKAEGASEAELKQINAELLRGLPQK